MERPPDSTEGWESTLGVDFLADDTFKSSKRQCTSTLAPVGPKIGVMQGSYKASRHMSISSVLITIIICNHSIKFVLSKETRLEITVKTQWIEIGSE